MTSVILQKTSNGILQAIVNSNTYNLVIPNFLLGLLTTGYTTITTIFTFSSFIHTI